MSEQLLLSDKYRPRRLSQIVGQDKAIAKLRANARKTGGYGGQAYWITGKTGQGKTTTARCIAAEIADPFFVTEIDAGGLTPADIDAIDMTWHTYAWGRKCGRAWIINEAHGLRRDTLRRLLALLEPGNVPKHCCVIFTTTIDGQALFENDMIDASPLLHRCSQVALTSQSGAAVVCRFVMKIADREGLNGSPIKRYINRLNQCGGSIRALLQAVQEGELKA